MTIIDIDSSAVTMKDYVKLPKGKYLLVVEGVFGSRAFVPIDKLTMDRLGNLHGYRMAGKKQEQVITFHGTRGWYLVDQKYIEALPLKEYMRQSAQKTSEFEKFAETLKTEFNLKDEPKVPEAPGEGGILYL